MESQDIPFGSPAAKGTYEKVLRTWSDGNQPAAEKLLGEAARTFRTERRLAFFAALLVRSRFNVEEAAPIFAFIAEGSSATRQGKAARLMLAIDQNKNTEASFTALGKLAMESKPVEPLIVWLYAISARTLRKNKAGIAAYTLLLKNIRVGSALVHQTFGNLLDGENRYEEALVHRKLAVKLEPAPWSYDGLAMTLHRLNRNGEALKILEQVCPKISNFPLIWCHWGIVLSAVGRNKEALEKLDKAIAQDPSDPTFRRTREEILREMK